jgi:hypothetical protein
VKRVVEVPALKPINEVIEIMNKINELGQKLRI